MNAFLIERLAIELRKQLVGSQLLQAYTTSQFDINLVFEPFALKVSFYQGQAYFQTPDPNKLQKKNRLYVYKSAIGAKVIEVKTYSYDRRIDFILEHGEELAFYLFGKFGQITHYQNSIWQDSFPVKSSKLEVYEETKYVVRGKSLDELKFLLPSDKEALLDQEYNAQNDDTKVSLLEELKNKVISQRLYINKGEKKYTLDYEAKAEPIASFDNVLEALGNHSRLYISHHVFNQTKNSHMGQLRKELTAIAKKLKSAEKRLSELNKASSYKEKADLLMANMWQIEKRAKQVVLTSFDGEKEVTIKLQELLTPQANAERYYNKGKNESKQRDFALKHLAEIESNYLAKEEEIEDFEQVDNLKQIRKTADKKTAQKEVRYPYKTMIIDGFEIRIGKGAKDNDDLLRYHTTKTDTWLHAKDVSGSHVIIRNPGNAKINPLTIEKVASIAAFYSKSKSELLAAVIYTDRKYIRKPKGATPGLVKVDKEKMILVEPMSSVSQF
ncbi:MAG: putative ribosome quality control (RQC) complex YloA/Tae2 family protein [Bacteroidia bacterium]|jgi:predicted ribosome quality control (RQC) complex YloA/Tae2 family protein